MGSNIEHFKYFINYYNNMRLEEKVKVAITGDYHVPFLNKNAYNTMKKEVRIFKPDVFIINGDFMDMYSISKFDKNPKRKSKLSEDFVKSREVLMDLRKTLGSKVKMYFLEGNHENRLQRYLWANPELEDLPELELGSLLHLRDYGINHIKVDGDYWKTDNGHLKLGKNTIVLHGDNRLNGASTSKYAGYSAKNTMMNMQTNIIMGHVHRLAQVYHSTPYGDMVGIENGCLCEKTGTANWQQGFVTTEIKKGKLVNTILHKV